MIRRTCARRSGRQTLDKPRQTVPHSVPSDASSLTRLLKGYSNSLMQRAGQSADAVPFRPLLLVSPSTDRSAKDVCPARGPAALSRPQSLIRPHTVSRGHMPVCPYAGCDACCPALSVSASSRQLRQLPVTVSPASRAVRRASSSNGPCCRSRRVRISFRESSSGVRTPSLRAALALEAVTWLVLLFSRFR